MRYLIDRGIRGTLEIRGDGRAVPGLGLVFDDPEIAPADWTPRLSVLSLDIETDPSARRLLAVGLHGCGVSEVLLLTPPRAGAAPKARGPSPPSRSCWPGFARRVRELDPDVLTGWNVVDFDLSVLARLAERLRVPLELGRGPGGLRLRAGGSARATPQASVPGRVVLDGIHLLRGAFIRMDDYGLDAVARSVLGEGKTLAGEGQGRARSCASSRKTGRGSSSTTAPTPGSPSRSSSGCGWSSSRSSAASSPACRPTASPAPSPPSTSSTSRSWDGGAWSPRASAPSQAAEPQAGGHVLEPDPRALRERGRARLQEPVPEPDPHLRDRPPEPRAAGVGRRGRRSHRGAQRRRLLPRARPSWARCSTSSCRGARRRGAPATRSRATRSRS